MQMPANHPSVDRVRTALRAANHHDNVTILDDGARTAQEAADLLGIAVGQVASSIVFGIPGVPEASALLVITSGRHRVDTALVAAHLGIEKLLRADADFVRLWSGFAIGGVSPLGWVQQPTILIDEALSEYDEVWAAAGHPHSVYPTTFAELIRCTGAVALKVGD
jgi:prolyl-tRNA editing enzyme YbaK/EbsC (Cys-tRNA(Pro) deacylase)